MRTAGGEEGVDGGRDDMPIPVPETASQMTANSWPVSVQRPMAAINMPSTTGSGGRRGWRSCRG